MALLPAGALFTRTGRRVIAVVAGVVVALLLGPWAMISSMAAVASVPGWSWGSGRGLERAWSSWWSRMGVGR